MPRHRWPTGATSIDEAHQAGDLLCDTTAYIEFAVQLRRIKLFIYVVLNKFTHFLTKEKDISAEQQQESNITFITTSQNAQQNM